MSNQVNQTWHKKNLGEIVSISRGITYSAKNLVSHDGYPYINMKSFLRGGGFNQEGLKFYKGIIKESDIVSKNDVLIVNTDVTDGRIIGLPLILPSFLHEEVVLHSHHVTALRFLSEDMDAEFLFRLLCLPSNRVEMRKYARGTTVLMLDHKGIKNIELVFPPKNHQKIITQILSTLDQAISTAEAIITKYQRIKTGMMKDLLTHGIDENGELRDPTTHEFKPSPLGMIPDEWDIFSLRRISKRITSGSRGWAKYYSEDGSIFIRIGNLTRENVNLNYDDIQYVNAPSNSEAVRTKVDSGNLLISITADLGIIGVVPKDFGDAYINQHIALVKLDVDQVNPWWVGNFLAGSTAQKHISMLNDSGAKAGLILPTIAALPIPIPNENEQNMIAGLIDRIDQTISLQKNKLEKHIRLKSGLMQDLLSGKVSVEPLLD